MNSAAALSNIRLQACDNLLNSAEFRPLLNVGCLLIVHNGDVMSQEPLVVLREMVRQTRDTQIQSQTRDCTNRGLLKADKIAYSLRKLDQQIAIAFNLVPPFYQTIV